MNVLLTSVGRRSYLADYFREAMQGQGKIIGANMYAEAAGMYAVDIPIVTPPANHPEYVPFLLDVCYKYDVKLLCSLHDLDVFMLSQQRHRFHEADVFTTLPTAEWGRITLDKWECTQVFAAASIDVPWTTLHPYLAQDAIQRSEIKYPLIVKARVGYGSLGLRRCINRQELEDAYESAKAAVIASGATQYIKLPEDELVLIQESITGREICVSILNDLNGDFLSHFVCEVHNMRAGESDSATSLDRVPFEPFARKISTLTKHSAYWGIDCLSDGNSLKVIDVNPRFTGDYPFHHLAGANVVRAVIQLVDNGSVNPDCLQHLPGIRGYKDIKPKMVI